MPNTDFEGCWNYTSSVCVLYTVLPSNKSLHVFPIFQPKYKEVRGGSRLWDSSMYV